MGARYMIPDVMVVPHTCVCYTRDCMQTGKRSLVTGVLLFIGIFVVVFVVIRLLGLFSAMPTKSDVINFANTMTDTATDTGIGVVGSLVPEGDGAVAEVATEESVPGTPTTIQRDWLSPEQRRLLSKLGIDESQLPTTLTPELEACLVEAVGETRVAAIKAGDAPTVVEGMKAMTCL
jgi:hypothetical protein